MIEFLVVFFGNAKALTIARLLLGSILLGSSEDNPIAGDECEINADQENIVALHDAPTDSVRRDD